MARPLTGASRNLGHGTEMVQHTPGPWKIAEQGRFVCDTARFIRSETEGTDHGAVACVALGSENARLIAAAPELLAALREMLDVQSRRQHPLGLPNEGISGDAASAASKARAAITKAEG